MTYYPGTPSPVVHPEKVNIDVFRENTEDIYAGIDTPAGSPEAKEWQALLEKQGQLDKVRFPETAAYAIKPISEEGTTRLVKAALDYALANDKHIVTLVHKGNIMKKTEGAFKQWGYQLADTYDETFTTAEYDRIKAAEAVLRQTLP